MRTVFIFAFFLLPLPLAGQEITTTPLPLIEIPVEDLDLGDEPQSDPAEDEVPLDSLLEELTSAPVEAPRETVAEGAAGALRVLDKLTGEVTDLELAKGETRDLGFLGVTMTECRYPVENPAGDAFVFVRATDLRAQTEIFSGWMIATAPALNAMDHPRYDIWALRCSTS